MQPKQSRYPMSDPFATLILTRPHPASARFLEQLGCRVTPGLRVVISPLFEIVPTGNLPDLDRIRGVIFTSANGVRFAGPGRGMAAHCVGPATRAAAAAAGWDARQTGATADDLVGALIARRPPAPLLHVGGIHRRGDVARRLSAAGIPTGEADVYDQRPLPLTPEARDALAGRIPLIVPLFSPRAASHFAHLAHLARATAPLHLVAMSDAVMAETRALTAASQHVAQEPTSAAMAEAVANILRRVEAEHAPQ